MISRGDRCQHVYRHLRARIVRGELAPGTRVVEQEVAEALKMGRTPVREALQMLLQEHFLVAAPGGRRQLSVSPMRADDARELFGVLGDLEASALRRLDPGGVAALAASARAANQAFAAAVRGPLDPERAFATHQAFHAALTAPLAGPRLAWLLGIVRPQVERYEWHYGPALEGALEVAVKEHEEIVRAVVTGNGEAAAAAVRQNWRNAAERLAGVIEAPAALPIPGR